MFSFTKESLTEALLAISNMGWVPNARKGNAGGVGNTLEELLGIEENNLPLPNAAEWELKAQRAKSAALTTLFHMEPSPRAMKIVPDILLPLYGWPHKDAGVKYPAGETSFRQTVNVFGTDRGFSLKIDENGKRVVISFDASKADASYKEWLDAVEKKVGLKELKPLPYWGFADLANKAGTKLLNCFYVLAETKKVKGEEYYHYTDIYRCSNFSFAKFLERIKDGSIYVDFDARTGHNHGTKFRLKQSKKDVMSTLYQNVLKIN